MIHVTTWINPNGIRLSGRSQSPKGNLIILSDCTYTIFSKRKSYSNREQINICQDSGGISKHVLTTRQHKRVWGRGVMKLFCTPIAVMVTLIHTYVKIQNYSSKLFKVKFKTVRVGQKEK